MKKTLPPITALALCLLALVGLAACGTSPAQESAPSVALEDAKNAANAFAFLHTYYTVEPAQAPPQTEEALEAHAQTYRAFADASCVEQMVKNRTVLTLWQEVAQNGGGLAVQDVELEEVESTSRYRRFAYTVEVLYTTPNGEEETLLFTGSMEMEDESAASPLVHSFAPGALE